jgi:hypothetical protein
VGAENAFRPASEGIVACRDVRQAVERCPEEVSCLANGPGRPVPEGLCTADVFGPAAAGKVTSREHSVERLDTDLAFLRIS